MNQNIDKYIRFILDHFHIQTLSSLCNRWNDILDWFFYFNKATGCGIPSFDEVRSYLKEQERSFIQYG